MSINKKLTVTFVIFILLMSLFIFTAAIEYNRSFQNHVKKTQDEAFLIKSNLENLITSRMIAVNGIKSHIEIHPEFTQNEFNQFAKDIYQSSNDVVLRISFLTDTTITHIFPYDVNKTIIGEDLAMHNDKKIWINRAKFNNKSIITGPVNIVEGGVGIVVRIPIQREGLYYGQVSIVFDYDKTLTSSGLMAFSNDNYVELIKVDEVNRHERVFWSNFPSQVNDNDCIKNTVSLYNSEMFLIAIPKGGFNGKSDLFYLILLIGLIIASMTSYIVFKLLTATVALKNSERGLKENKDELEALVGQLIANEEQLHIQYQEINEQKEYIQFLADRDYLTNLFNRRKFTEDITRHTSDNKSGTILLLDVDNFKNINDTQGHRYGDKVLSHIAHLLQSTLSKKASVYRIGGDEFVVHLPGVVESVKIEDWLKSFFAALKMNNYVDQIKNHITASVGIAKYPKDSKDADDILMKSDIAMYQAKKEGKNRFCYFSEDLISSFDSNVKIERELQNALEMDLFTLVYQPVVDSKTGNITSFEALLRIKGSSLSPGDFIPVAENTGLIIPIGNWVIDRVCMQLSTWRNDNIKIKPVAINVSPKQLYDDSIVDYIGLALEKYNLNSKFLEIEITENVLIGNSEYTIKLLNKLRDLGLLISLDDFGTGYSSLSYLSYIPVNKVKIDKSLKDKFLFLENVEFMEGLISVCHGLNLKVVTEGVETFEEYDKLRTIESDYVQGYYFEKPISPDKAALIIEKNYLNNES